MGGWGSYSASYRDTAIAPDAATHTLIMSIIASHLVILRISSRKPFDAISLNAHDMHCCCIIGRKMCFWLDTYCLSHQLKQTDFYTYIYNCVSFFTSLITFLGKSA